MAHNKVVFGDETIIDMTDADVTVDDLANGAKAYDQNGELITGRGINADTVSGWHFAVRNDGSPPESVTVPTLTLVYTEGG